MQVKTKKIRNWWGKLKARARDLTAYCHKTLPEFTFTWLFKFIVQKLLFFWSPSKSKCR